MLVNINQDPMVGSTLGGCYEILSTIGHGGMGVVYKARHQLMDRIVAIKMMKSQLISDTISVKRFQQEGKAYAKINHPHVITVFDFGVSPDGLPYIVMDFLEGHPLSDIIKKEGSVGVDRAVKVLSQACEALAHAHKQGIVHRDLKPGNIVLIEYDGDPDFVKVVDFGVAKLMNTQEQRLTQTGEVCGSPVYMSPEQCLGQEMDLRSDIYSMGIVIYETVTGKLPLIGRTMVDTMAKQVSEMPQPFSKVRPDLYIPERLQNVVFKAMAKDPAQRHQSMDELRDDLERAIPKPARTGSLRQVEPLAKAEEAVSGGISRTSLILAVIVSFSMMAGGLTLFKILSDRNASKQPSAMVSPEEGSKTTGKQNSPTNNSQSTSSEIEQDGSNPASTPPTASDQSSSKTSETETQDRESSKEKASQKEATKSERTGPQPGSENHESQSISSASKGDSSRQPVKTVAETPVNTEKAHPQAKLPAKKPASSVASSKHALTAKLKSSTTVPAHKKPQEKKPAGPGKDVWQSLRNELHIEHPGSAAH